MLWENGFDPTLSSRVPRGRFTTGACVAPRREQGNLRDVEKEDQAEADKKTCNDPAGPKFVK